MTTQATAFQAGSQALVEEFEATFGRGDAAGVAEFYSEQGMLLPAGFGFIRGRQEIQAFWQGAMDMGIKNAKIDTLEMEQHGDTVIEVGNYTLSDAENQVIEYGKGMVIWKYEGGLWKIHRDMWTSNVASV